MLSVKSKARDTQSCIDSVFNSTIYLAIIMLRLYGADNKEVTYDQPTQFCGNPACLSEPWRSAWGTCKDAAIWPCTTTQSSRTHGRSELEINDLFLQASQAFESSSAQHHQRPRAMALHKPSSITSRSAMPKTDEEGLQDNIIGNSLDF